MAVENYNEYRNRKAARLQLRQTRRIAAATRNRVLDAAKSLFSERGVDAVRIAELAAHAGVSPSTIYGSFKSKEGVLRALLERTLFGGRYQAAAARLEEDPDPVRQIIETASVARAIYESRAAELGFVRGISAFSPALRQLERSFEDLRLELQRNRIERLFAAGKARESLSVEEARRILWMYTSGDVYRLLVEEGGWTADRYEEWLKQTLETALVKTD